MGQSLYREEAILEAGQRHLGEPALDATRPLLRLTFALLVCIIAVGTLISSSQFSRKHSVQGRVDLATTNTLVASEFGYIAELAIKEGDSVSEGEHLGKLVSRQTSAVFSAELESQGRTLKEMTVLATQTLQKRRRHAAARDRQLTRIATLTREDIKLQRRKVQELEEQVQRTRKLHQQGYLSSLDFLRFKQSLIGEQQALNGLHQKLAGYHDQRLQLRQSLDLLHETTANRLSEITLRQSDLRQARSEQTLKHERSLIATSSGTVTRIEILQGSYLVPGQPILHISASENPFSGSLYLPSHSMAGVEVGQHLQLSFDAYPQDQYGKVDARITSLTSPAMRDQESAFIARLDILPPTSNFMVVPGMTFTTHVIIESRSILSWLMRPLEKLGENFEA